MVLKKRVLFAVSIVLPCDRYCFMHAVKWRLLQSHLAVQKPGKNRVKQPKNAFGPIDKKSTKWQTFQANTFVFSKYTCFLLHCQIDWDEFLVAFV